MVHRSSAGYNRAKMNCKSTKSKELGAYPGGKIAPEKSTTFFSSIAIPTLSPSFSLHTTLRINHQLHFEVPRMEAVRNVGSGEVAI